MNTRNLVFLLIGGLLVTKYSITYNCLKSLIAPMSGDKLLRRYEKVELDMSERTVIRLLGSPHSTRSDLGRWNYPIETSQTNEKGYTYDRVQIYFVDGKVSGKRKYAYIVFDEGFGFRPPNLSDAKWNKEKTE